MWSSRRASEMTALCSRGLQRGGRTSWVSLTEEMGCQLGDSLILRFLASIHARIRQVGTEIGRQYVAMGEGSGSSLRWSGRRFCYLTQPDDGVEQFVSLGL
ncbi:Uncharacterised protein [Mycobacteroides abscessus subsp. bolletii]|nr:Uncharacterised protein [Mycobacteroides abscessus subsp. bolletii]SKS81810.1 Uncharacterised protein [Mycobacteroides abscessus subsp. bolletii]